MSQARDIRQYCGMNLRGRRPDDLAGRRKLNLMVAAGLSLVGLGAAVALLQHPPAEEFAPIVVGELPKPDGRVAPGPRHTDPETELSFPRFMEILGAEASNPVVAPLAKSFASAFTAKPELKAIYEDFKRRADRGQKPQAKDFLASLRPNPAFQKLTSDFGRGPAGSAAFMAIAHNPEMKRFLAQQDRVLAAAGRPDRRMQWIRGRGSLGSGGGAGGPGNLSGFGPGAARGPLVAMDLARGPGGATIADAASSPGTQSSPGGQAGPDAHNTTPLDTKWKDTKTIAKTADGEKIEKLLRQYPCLGPLGEATVWRFINGSDIDAVGLWGACFQLHLYGTCKGTGCSAPLTCWQSCLNANDDNERACIQKTRTQPGCGQGDIPGDVWQANCVPRRNAQGKCMSPTPPIPECGLGACIDEVGGAAACAALANRPLAQRPDDADRARARGIFENDPTLQEQFRTGLWKNGRDSPGASYEEALERYTLEFTRDRQTPGWRGCGVSEGGYFNGAVTP